MPRKLTLEDARLSLRDHVAARAQEIRARYGPRITLPALTRILGDRACVRYPVELSYDAALLQEGEFAHPVSKGDRPENGFVMAVHPFFGTMPGIVPALVLYQLVLVNYGEFASPADAEIFGATVLGISREEYYRTLCEAADMLEPGKTAPACGEETGQNLQSNGQGAGGCPACRGG